MAFASGLPELVGVAMAGCVAEGRSSKLMVEPTVNDVVGVVVMADEPVVLVAEYPGYVLILPTGKTCVYVSADLKRKGRSKSEEDSRSRNSSRVDSYS